MLTQQAISDALENENKLRNGAPVNRCTDNEVNVRTLEAVCCAIERLKDYRENLTIGLIAHDKHYQRSRQALEAVLKDKKPGARLVDIHIGKTPYQDDTFYRPWWWAIRELGAIPLAVSASQIGMFSVSGRSVEVPTAATRRLTVGHCSWRPFFIPSMPAAESIAWPLPETDA